MRPGDPGFQGPKEFSTLAWVYTSHSDSLIQIFSPLIASADSCSFFFLSSIYLSFLPFLYLAYLCKISCDLLSKWHQWVFVGCLQVCVGGCGCVRLMPGLCADVRGCTQVCVGVCRCAQVCPGMPGCACVG